MQSWADVEAMVEADPVNPMRLFHGDVRAPTPRK
jgi:hypothetical protein